MLSTADVEVDRHPVLFLLRIDERLFILRIDVTEVVPAGTCPLGHCVGFPLCGTAALGTLTVNPAFNVHERGFACAGRFILVN